MHLKYVAREHLALLLADIWMGLECLVAQILLYNLCLYGITRSDSPIYFELSFLIAYHSLSSGNDYISKVSQQNNPIFFKVIPYDNMAMV